MSHSAARAEDALRLLVLLTLAGGTVLWYRKYRTSSTVVGAHHVELQEKLRTAREAALEAQRATVPLEHARRELAPTLERLRAWNRRASSQQFRAVRPR